MEGDDPKYASGCAVSHLVASEAEKDTHHIWSLR